MPVDNDLQNVSMHCVRLDTSHHCDTCTCLPSWLTVMQNGLGKGGPAGIMHQSKQAAVLTVLQPL